MLVSVIVAAVLAAPATAQCNRVVHVVEKNVQGEFTGTLEKHVFNGESGKPVTAYLLRLKESICADDGEVYADVFDVFDSVHVTPSPAAQPWLDAHIGQSVTLTGHIFAARDATHFAPLVMALPKNWTPPR